MPVVPGSFFFETYKDMQEFAQLAKEMYGVESVVVLDTSGDKWVCDEALKLVWRPEDEDSAVFYISIVQEDLPYCALPKDNWVKAINHYNEVHKSILKAKLKSRISRRK
jgi:hypothetical protein